jgi:SseB protein C-terminal domain
VIVLNPGMQYGKAFSLTEISGLLDGTLLAPEMSDISQGHEVFLGVPRVYPTALVNALSQLFRDFDAVEAAYLAHVFILESGEPPHSCIGLKLSQPEALPVILEFAVNLQKQVAPDKLVDFVQVEEDSEDDVVKYLLKTEPFYKGE